MAGIESPFITGQEIDSYQGNAGLGGVNYQFNPAIQNPLQGLDNTMAALQQQSFQAQQQKDQQNYNTMARLQDYDQQDKVRQYQQAIKDRDARYAMFNDLNNSAATLRDEHGNIQNIPYLADDQKYLTDKASALKQIAMSNPGNYEDNTDYQKGMQEYNQLKNLASSRTIEYRNQQQQLAQAQAQGNTDEADNIKANMALEFDKTPLSQMKPVDPHLPGTSTNWDKVHSQGYLSDKSFQDSYTINGQDKVGVKASERDIRDQMRPGTSYYQNMWGGGTGAVPLLLKHDGTNPVLAQGDNAKAEQYNSEWGYQPGDPHYMPPPFTINQDGTVQPNSVDNLGYFIASSHLLPSDDPDAESDEADLAEKVAKTRLLNQEAADKAKGKQGKMSATDLKEENMRQNFQAAYSTVNDAFKNKINPSNNPGTPALTQDGKDVSLSNLGNFNITSALRDNGLDPKNWEAYSYQGGDKFIPLVGVQHSDNKGKESGETEVPDYAFPIRNPQTGEVKLVFTAKDKNNPKKQALVSIVDKRQAMENFANHVAKYNKGDKNLPDQISYNDNAFDMAERNGGQAPIAQQPKTVTGNFKQTKTIGGQSYGQDASGKWYKI